MTLATSKSSKKSPKKSNSFRNTLIPLAVAIVGLIVFMLNDSGKHWYYQTFTSAIVHVDLSDGKQPVPNVTVYLDSPKYSALTDSKGDAMFPNISKGPHKYSLKYKTKFVKVNLTVEDEDKSLTLPWNFAESDTANQRELVVSIGKLRPAVSSISPKPPVTTKITEQTSQGPITKTLIDTPVVKLTTSLAPPNPKPKFPQLLDTTQILMIKKRDPQLIYKDIAIRINSVSEGKNKANIAIGTLSDGDVKEFTFKGEDNINIYQDSVVTAQTDDGLYRFFVKTIDLHSAAIGSWIKVTAGSYKLR